MAYTGTLQIDTTSLTTSLDQMNKQLDTAKKNFSALTPVIEIAGNAMRMYVVFDAFGLSLDKIKAALKPAQTELDKLTVGIGKQLDITKLLTDEQGNLTLIHELNKKLATENAEIDTNRCVIMQKGKELTNEQAQSLLESVGALTAHTAATSISTAVTGISTTANQLFKASIDAIGVAIKSNPLGFFIGVATAAISLIPSIVAGISDLWNWAKKTNDVYTQNEKRVDALAAAQERLNRQTEDSAASYQTNTQVLRAQAQVMDGVANAMIALSQKENKTAAEKQRLAEYVRLLNDSESALNLTYDAQTGALSMTKEELEKYLDARRQIEEVQMTQERQNELLQQEIELNAQLTAVKESLAEAAGATYLGQNEQMKELQALEQSYTEQLAANAENQQACLDSLAQANTQAAQATIDGHQTQLDSQAAMLQAQEEAVQRQTELLHSLADETTNAFTRIDTGTAQSAGDLVANLRHNQESISSWADNLAILADSKLDKGFLQVLRDAGPSSAATVAALAAANEEELILLGETYRNGLQVAADAFPNILGSEETTSVASKAIDSMAKEAESNQALSTAMEKIVIDAHTQMQQKIQSCNFPGLGVNVALGVANGIRLGTNEACAAATAMGLAVYHSYRAQIRSNSPSKLFRQLSLSIPQGVALGIDDGAPTAATAVKKMAVDLQQAFVAQQHKLAVSSLISATAFAQANPYPTQAQAAQASAQKDITVNLTAQLDGREIYKNQQKIAQTWGYDLGGGKYEW